MKRNGNRTGAGTEPRKQPETTHNVQGKGERQGKLSAARHWAQSSGGYGREGGREAGGFRGRPGPGRGGPTSSRPPGGPSGRSLRCPSRCASTSAPASAPVGEGKTAVAGESRGYANKARRVVAVRREREGGGRQRKEGEGGREAHLLQHLPKFDRHVLHLLLLQR